MSIIKQYEYIDAKDLPTEAKDVYEELCIELDLHNGELWGWRVGDTDDVVESYIGAEKVAIIDKALLDAGLVVGQDINLQRSW